MIKKYLIKLPMIKTSGKHSFPVSLILTLLFGVMLLLANFLLIAKTEQALKTSLKNTALTAVEDLQGTLTQGYTLGLYPETLLNQTLLQRLVKTSIRIRSIDWYNTQGQRVIGSGDSSFIEQISSDQLKALSQNSPQLELAEDYDGTKVALSIRSTFGQPIGYLVVDYSAEEIKKLRESLIDESLHLFPRLLGIGAFFFVALFFLGKRFTWARNQSWSLSLLSTLGMFVMAFFLFKQAEMLIQPLLKERLESIASVQENLWTKAYINGFSLENFEPLDIYFSDLQNTHKEIGNVTLVSSQNNKLPSIKIDPDTAIALEPNPGFLKNIQIEMSLDYLTLALVLFFFWSQFRDQKIDQVGPQQALQINSVRPLLFLFFLSEEFIRPILPNYSASKEVVWNGLLNESWIPSLSISVFMVIVALSQPFLNRIKSLSQAKHYWLTGALLVTLGQAMLWLSPWAEGLLMSRVLAGLGYACSFVASQSMLLMIYGSKQRVSAFASLVVCIMAATIVGPAFGGLLTDYFGTQAAIALAIGSPLLALLWMAKQKTLSTHQPVDHYSSESSSVKVSILAGITHPKLLALTLFAAVPAKAMLTGLLFFLIPTLTIGTHLSPADTGRLILVYGFIMLVAVPCFSKVSAKLGPTQSNKFVSIGLMVSSLSGLLPLLSLMGMIAPPSAMSLALPIAVALGLGQAIAISSQAALAQSLQIIHAPGLPPFAWLGTYRFVERPGNAIGPPLVALLLFKLGPEATLLSFGAVALVCACIAYFGLKQDPYPLQEKGVEA